MPFPALSGTESKNLDGENAPVYTRHLWLIDYTTLIAQIRDRLLIQSRTKLGRTFCDFRVLGDFKPHHPPPPPQCAPLHEDQRRVWKFYYFHYLSFFPKIDKILPKLKYNNFTKSGHTASTLLYLDLEQIASCWYTFMLLLYYYYY